MGAHRVTATIRFKYFANNLLRHSNQAKSRDRWEHNLKVGLTTRAAKKSSINWKLAEHGSQ